MMVMVIVVRKRGKSKEHEDASETPPTHPVLTSAGGLLEVKRVTERSVKPRETSQTREPASE